MLDKLVVTKEFQKYERQTSVKPIKPFRRGLFVYKRQCCCERTQIFEEYREKLQTVNSALCLIIALHRCTLFHMYIRCLLALEVIAKFICNVKQRKIKNNTKTTEGNEL